MEDKQKRISVSLSKECYEALRKFAFDTNASLSTAAKVLCEEGLKRHNYENTEVDHSNRTVKN